MELRDQQTTEQDHHCPQHNCADDANDQRTLLVFDRHREVGEDHQEYEDVVDRQRLLDQITGEELTGLHVRDFAPGMAVEIPPQTGAEQQRAANPDQRPDQCFLDRDLVRTLCAHDDEIDHEGDQHKGGKARPHPPLSDRFHHLPR